MNLPESLPSSGTPDLAALAAKSAVLRRAASLAGWAGGGKRAPTAKGVLRKQDVPAAAAIIGVKAPQAVRSAADLPECQGGIRVAEQGARLVLLMSGQRRV